LPCRLAITYISGIIFLAFSSAKEKHVYPIAKASKSGGTVEKALITRFAQHAPKFAKFLPPDHLF
jgi:hypothetical protein